MAPTCRQGSMGSAACTTLSTANLAWTAATQAVRLARPRPAGKAGMRFAANRHRRVSSYCHPRGAHGLALACRQGQSGCVAGDAVRPEDFVSHREAHKGPISAGRQSSWGDWRRFPPALSLMRTACQGKRQGTSGAEDSVHAAGAETAGGWAGGLALTCRRAHMGKGSDTSNGWDSSSLPLTRPGSRPASTLCCCLQAQVQA